MPLIKIERYTLGQRIEIVEIHYKNGEKKLLWAMKLIFTMKATLISSIVAFGTRKTQKWWPELEDMDVDDVYFQQDGATCQTSGETIGLSREKFLGRVISRNGDYSWPPRSHDLTTLDFFLRGYVKNGVYVDAPQSI